MLLIPLFLLALILIILPLTLIIHYLSRGTEHRNGIITFSLGEEENLIPQIKEKNVRDVEDDSPQLIPKVIFQTNTYDLITPGIKVSTEIILRMNPEYEYKYFNDIEMRDFIKSNFSEEIYNAYSQLYPGAFRSDFFRACYLYINGGVYIDCGFVEIVPLRKIISENHTFISSEDNKRTHCDKKNCSYIHNAFMASVKSHPILERTIELMVENISKRNYDDELHGITGPRVVGRAFVDVIGDLHVGEYDDTSLPGIGGRIKIMNSIYFGDIKSAIISDVGNTTFSMIRKNPLFYTKSSLYRSEQKIYNKPHYAKYFENKQVFFEEGSLPTEESEVLNDDIIKSINQKKRVSSIFEFPFPFEKEYYLSKISETRIPRYKSPKINRIPLIIAQTNETENIPINMCKSIEYCRDLNPEYTHIFFTSEKRREFISSHCPEVLESYDSIIPGAFKSDIFRMCFLYIFGGIYIDSSMFCIVPFREFINKDDEFIAAIDDFGTHITGRTCLYNAFIACVPKSPIIKKMIDVVVRNIKSRKTSNPLDITGPIAFAEAFESVMNVPPERNTEYSLPSPSEEEPGKVRVLDYYKRDGVSRHSAFITDGKEYHKKKDRVLLLTKYPGYYSDRNKYNTVDYDTSYKNGIIFK